MIALALVFGLSTAKESLFVGTYTSRSGSDGIYRVVLDEGTGALSPPEIVAETPNPSYLALSPSGSELYAVDESSRGAASAYRIEGDDRLAFLNRQPVPGDGSCYLSVDPRGRSVLVASYGGGFVSSLQIHSDGSLSPVVCQIQNQGSGPDRSRQEQPHMHWVAADPRDRFVYSCDLGTDKVRCDRFDPATGKFEPGDAADASVPPGSGARHAAFGPRGSFLYVDSEMGESVTVFRVTDRSGSLARLQTLSALPDNARRGSTAAEIECHSNGRWLYVSNRSDNSISVFGIERNGLLMLLQVQSSTVRTPRGFAIDPAGRWLVVAGQDSNDLVALPIDPKSGRLGEAGPRVSIGAPTCVVFPRR